MSDVNGVVRTGAMSMGTREYFFLVHEKYMARARRPRGGSKGVTKDDFDAACRRAWAVLHAAANACRTPKHVEDVRTLLVLVRYGLLSACADCAAHYESHVRRHPIPDDPAAMAHYMYDFHAAVNRRVDPTYVPPDPETVIQRPRAAPARLLPLKNNLIFVKHCLGCV